MVSFCWGKLLLCFAAAVLTFFIAGLETGLLTPSVYITQLQLVPGTIAQASVW
jgi:hypothetical protein